ncbi:LytR/AlgR family response regulator transcription factor [Reichenbachiella versicolor]|uniref:LytR/AlgR family response regulator transcription factor n=1 Tax=Reichenbachiella versicolor TaxID=1821036 RepID=UPI000D6DD338|nr:response regulator [Reichenbachiella versicolor]
MNNIRAVIIDDELNGRENLKGTLSKHCPNVQIIGQANSAVEGIKTIQEHSPELVFLDIEMPGGNGFEVLKFFDNPDFKVIFVTAYDHFAIQAIKFSALDYILKPIDALQLIGAVNKLEKLQSEWNRKLQNFLTNEHIGRERQRIALTFSDKIEFIEINKIIRCQGEGAYTRFFIADSPEILTSKPLSEYESLLAEFGFIRTHKAHIINKAHISSFVKSDGGYLVMSDQSIAHISRRRKEEVIQQLKG